MPNFLGNLFGDSVEDKAIVFKKALLSGDRAAVNRHLSQGSMQLIRDNPQAVAEAKKLLGVYKRFTDTMIKDLGGVERASEPGILAGLGAATSSPTGGKGTPATKAPTTDEFVKSTYLNQQGLDAYIDKFITKGKKPEGFKEITAEAGKTGAMIKTGFQPALTPEGFPAAGKLVPRPTKPKRELILAERKAKIEEGKIRNAAARVAIEKQRLEKQGLAGESASLNVSITREALRLTRDAVTEDMTQEDMWYAVGKAINEIRVRSGLKPMEMPPLPEPVSAEEQLTQARQPGQGAAVQAENPFQAAGTPGEVKQMFQQSDKSAQAREWAKERLREIEASSTQ